MKPTDFSLNNAPAAAVTRRLPPPPRAVRRRRWLLRRVPVLVQLLCAAGVALLGLSLWQAGSYWLITRFGATVDGEVIARSPLEAPLPTERRIEYRYHVRGEEYSAEDGVDEGAFDTLQVGTGVKLRVLPAWPRRPYLVQPPGHAGRGGGVLLWFAILANVLLALLLWRSLRGPLRQRALVRGGVATPGVVVSKEAGVGGGSSWGVEFCYRAPRHGVTPGTVEGEVADKEWQVRMAVRRADYEAVRIGAAVTILYDPLQPGHSLIYAFADYAAVDALADPLP